MRGRYVLFQHRRQELDDPPDGSAGPGLVRRFPTRFRRCARSRPPGCRRTTAAWGYELVWDGVRVVGYVSGGRLRLLATDGTRRHRGVPGATCAGRVARAHRVRPRRRGGRLRQLRTGQCGGAAAARSAGQPTPRPPVAWRPVRRCSSSRSTCCGSTARSTMDAAVRRAARRCWTGSGPRRRELADPAVLRRAAGGAVRRPAAEQGLRGVVAKRLDAPYAPGESAKAWRRVT